MKRILILIAISAIFASCTKEDTSPQYDNSPLANKRWQALSGSIKLSFTSTDCTEQYGSLNPITKPYFLVGDMLYFYSLQNNASVKIQLMSNSSMLYNIKPNGSYEYYFTKY